ncbi:unnamed protein product [Rotaria sordida]|uniref:DOMON domain-containing protein n=1 Tax=Rotaria sordida TaxID=392033 RepID=A0A815DXU1_9BILA|nr:unnamed protein product [Rotaria sordida]
MTKESICISSPLTPFTIYNYSTSLEVNVSDLWWNIDETSQEIIFELHVKTTGWIGLGISRAGGMAGADIALGWVDQTGTAYIQDRYAYNHSRPIIDDGEANWIVLQGREVNGWTAIQFKRKFDTCDPMDVPIMSGTNNLIFAYGLVDPDLSQPNNDITYHGSRRGSRTLPLRSYSNPPSASEFATLDSIEFRLNNFAVPSEDTIYYCEVFKTPTNFITKRHAIAYEIFIDPANLDIVHHLLMFECDPTVNFNGTILPQGLCDQMDNEVEKCMVNTALGWAVGGDFIVEYPEQAGYPLGANFSVGYYMIQMHYNNPQRLSNRVDASGIRFFLGNTLRQYDLGYLTLGTTANAMSLAIPPNIEQFNVDSYCPMEATENIPESGITVFGAFPHAHLQGRSIWTKLIRNGMPTDYLFNAQSFDFNYQFGNTLPKPIQLYPGDAFYTRCVYNTMNKNIITLGGESTKQEMCLHFFSYYPRMPDLSVCLNLMTPQSWNALINDSSIPFSQSNLIRWLLQRQWTTALATKWQEFYNNALRIVVYGQITHIESMLATLPPRLQDVEPDKCTKQVNPEPGNAASKTNHTIRQTVFILAITIFRALKISFENLQ